MRFAIQQFAVLLLSICVHEFGHAFIADKLGDDLPRQQGRLTLNPLAHADPIGTFLFPLVGILYYKTVGFGWGKPVQTMPNRYTRRFEMRTGHMFVAFAGPMMNVIFGTLLCILHVALWKGGVHNEQADKILYYAVSLNFVLFFFNLVPAPPLDGGAVTRGLLPRSALDGFDKFAVYGPFILMSVILIPALSHIFLWPADYVTQHLYKGLGTVFGL